MGSDDIFKRRKAQTHLKLERRREDRERGLRFLIICEGQKTEPFYFTEFCEIHQLLTARVRILSGSEGSSPDRVVSYAKQVFDEDAKLGSDSYDQVFCVIDRDNHTTFESAMRQIKKLKSQGAPFVAVPSYPCFEYWLLLHFTYTRRGFTASGGRSSCDNLIRELQKQPGFQSYVKARKNIYSLLKDRTETAIKHAQMADKEAAQTREKNPSTDVYKLVLELQKLVIDRGRR